MFKDVEMYPKPVQIPFPIYVGRHLTTERVLRWVAYHAQGWIPGLTPRQFADSVPRLRAYAKEYGRSIHDIDIVREVSLSIADTKEAALKAYLSSPAQAHMRSLSKGKKLIDFEAENRVSLIGTAEDVIEGIQAYMNTGVTHFMFNIAVRKPQDLITGMKKFVEKVLPSFR